jgi:ethanolamine ammonia-lyase small subunit
MAGISCKGHLMRPDLGRRLAPCAEAMLAAQRRGGFDVLFVVADGLSARVARYMAAPKRIGFCLSLA